MPVAFIVGPLAALVGIVAIYFVFRRKAVDKKKSMYSARRSQIEHKVRAARQRTLAPQGRAEKPPEAPPEVTPTSIFAPSPSTPRVTYEPSAYQPPPAAPAAPPKETGASPWDVPPAAPDHTPAPYVPPATPAPIEEAWVPAPVEPPPPSEVWTPAPAATPAEAAPVEPKRSATPPASPGSWAVVSDAAKESAETADAHPKKKGKQEASGSAWQLSSGEAPGEEAEGEDDVVKAPNALVPIAQYAVLVVGLVMVLIGVLVMMANSHVT